LYISCKDLQNFIKSAGTIVPDKNNGLPVNNLDSDKIIANDFKGDGKIFDAAIVKDGKFIPIIEKQQFLHQIKQMKYLRPRSSLTNSFFASRIILFL
jgi:hypothetical protein